MAKRSATVVVLIGILKLVKAALLLVVGAAGLLAVPERMANGAQRLVDKIGFSLGRETVQHVLGKLWSMDPATAHRWGALSLCYAAVFLVEGVGLILEKRWAEWLTVVVTASFIPLEIYETYRRFGAGKVVTLALNVAIVIYLAWRRLEDRRGASRLVRRAASLVS